MPITRDKASRVLTATEMGLFTDSRSSAVRALGEKALVSRVDRSRKLRDKSRDLLQRQKLKSRENTGSKLGASGVANQRTATKGEILDDILQRFESRLQEVQAAGEAGLRTARKTKSRATASKAAPRKVGSESSIARSQKPAVTRVAAKPAPKPRTSATSKTVAVASAASANAAEPAGAAISRPGKAAKRADASKAQDGKRVGKNATKTKTSRAKNKRAITPERALENTRALLEAKQQRERETPAYLAIDSHAASVHATPGYQSGVAKAKAQELHEGEMRMQAIQGSISTHDRHNQGERDGR